MKKKNRLQYIYYFLDLNWKTISSEVQLNFDLLNMNLSKFTLSMLNFFFFFLIKNEFKCASHEMVWLNSVSFYFCFFVCFLSYSFHIIKHKQIYVLINLV